MDHAGSSPATAANNLKESEAAQMAYKDEIEKAAQEYVAYYADDATVMHRKFKDMDEVFVECHTSGDAERVAAELNHRYDFGIKVGYKQGELRGRTDAHLDTTAEIAMAVNAFLRNSKLSIMDSSFGGSVMAWHVYHDDAEGEYESTAATPLEAILDWYEDTK